MTLTPEQKEAVSQWISTGDNLSAVQKKLSEQFKLSMTYRDVRFLVDDLNLELKDAAPKVDASDVSKAQLPKAAAARNPRGAGPTNPVEADNDGAETDAGYAADEMPDEGVAPLGQPASNVSVDLDKVSLIPGALASGSVTFSDGVTGKWVVDQQGRPGFTQVSQPGYRPSPADGQAFMQELSSQLQKRGF